MATATGSNGEASNYAARATTIRLLHCSAVIPLVFWAITFICGFVLGDPNHFSRAMSELGTEESLSKILLSRSAPKGRDLTSSIKPHGLAPAITPCRASS